MCWACRMTPLVSLLNPDQVEQLRKTKYFAETDPNISFPGFRQDLSHLSQVGQARPALLSAQSITFTFQARPY